MVLPHGRFTEVGIIWPMSGRDYVAQRWQSFLGLTIAGGMLVWGRFLDPCSATWLSGAYATYFILCVVATVTSIALAWQESMAAWRHERLNQARRVRQAHAQFSLSAVMPEVSRES